MDPEKLIVSKCDPMEVAFCADDSHSGHSCYARYIKDYEDLGNDVVAHPPMDYPEWRYAMTMMNPGEYPGTTDEEINAAVNPAQTPIFAAMEKADEPPALTLKDLDDLRFYLSLQIREMKNTITGYERVNDTVFAIPNTVANAHRKLTEMTELYDKLDKIHSDLHESPF